MHNSLINLYFIVLLIRSMIYCWLACLIGSFWRWMTIIIIVIQCQNFFQKRFLNYWENVVSVLVKLWFHQFLLLLLFKKYPKDAKFFKKLFKTKKLMRYDKVEKTYFCKNNLTCSNFYMFMFFFFFLIIITIIRH